MSLPQAMHLLAYSTITRHTLEYAVIIWDSFTKTNIKKLQRTQLKASIYNYYDRTSITELPRQTGPPSVADRNRINQFKTFPFLQPYKLLDGHYQIDISRIIPTQADYTTRRAHSLPIILFTPRNNSIRYVIFQEQ